MRGGTQGNDLLKKLCDATKIQLLGYCQPFRRLHQAFMVTGLGFCSLYQGSREWHKMSDNTGEWRRHTCGEAWLSYLWSKTLMWWGIKEAWNGELTKILNSQVGERGGGKRGRDWDRWLQVDSWRMLWKCQVEMQSVGSLSQQHALFCH